jgi:hypothetical protein
MLGQASYWGTVLFGTLQEHLEWEAELEKKIVSKTEKDKVSHKAALDYLKTRVRQ